MQIWQIAITLLVVILVGAIAGVLISYILFRLVYHHNLNLMAVCRILLGKRPVVIPPGGSNPSGRRKVPALSNVYKQVKTPVATNNDDSALPDVQLRDIVDLHKLFTECEQNREIIRGISGNNLKPLRTEAWDSNRNLIISLNHGLRDNLESVYTDITLLNNLVWLSTEFHRSGEDIQTQYRLLSEKIAIRLDSIIEATHAYFASK